MVDRIVEISDLTKDDIPIAGGKGANLGELVGAGFNVPPGFVLTTVAYDYFVQSNDIEKRMGDILEGVDANSESSLQSASVRIRGLFEQMPIPKDLAEQIRSEWIRMWKGRKSGFVAVRSSATAEDLPTASFAGQQDTYLNVGDAGGPHGQDQEVLVLSVHAAGHLLSGDQGLRALQGQVGRRGSEDGGNSDISGIMFTVDPNSEMPHIIIEAGYGLGEAIVGGKVTPDTYVVDKFHNKIINKKISKQTWKFVRGKIGDTVKEDIPERLVSAQKMTDEQIIALGEIGNDIEVHYDQAHGHRVGHRGR